MMHTFRYRGHFIHSTEPANGLPRWRVQFLNAAVSVWVSTGEAAKRVIDDRMGAPNARFWVWLNDGWVKLTLHPGQSLEWGSSGPADEGWAASYERWEHLGDRVRRETVDEGADCDGRYSRDTAGDCLLDDLAVIETDDEDEGRPIYRADWSRFSERQRDFAAEAMGY